MARTSKTKASRKLTDKLGAGQNRLTSANDLSGSRFRKRYRQLNDGELAWNDEIKDYAAKLEVLIEALMPSYYGTIALLYLEIAIMFAVKELTKKYPINSKTKKPYTVQEINKLLQKAKIAKAD